MERIIEELFYGNVTPSERRFRKDGKYANVFQLAVQNEDKLTATLTEAQKETFEKFKDNASELECLAELAAFTNGFKMGQCQTAESFIGGRNDQELIAESFHAHRIHRVRWRFFKQTGGTDHEQIVSSILLHHRQNSQSSLSPW